MSKRNTLDRAAEAAVVAGRIVRVGGGGSAGTEGRGLERFNSDCAARRERDMRPAATAGFFCTAANFEGINLGGGH